MPLPSPQTGVPVVITGASTGIGAALAHELAGRGHDLVLVARRRPELRAVAREVEARAGIGAEIRPADLADADDRRALIAELGGRAIAGLCNNAGVGSVGPYLEADREHLTAMIELNVAASNDLMAALLPGMVERGEGAMLNVASVLGHGPQPHNAVYGATKAFLVALSEAVHAELAGTGVSVTALSPGPVRTGIWDSSGAPELEDAGPDVLWQDPEDVARAAVDAMERGARSSVPGLVNALAAAGSRYLPRTVTLPVQATVGTVVKRLGL